MTPNPIVTVSDTPAPFSGAITPCQSTSLSAVRGQSGVRYHLPTPFCRSIGMLRYTELLRVPSDIEISLNKDVSLTRSRCWVLCRLWMRPAAADQVYCTTFSSGVRLGNE